MHTNAIFMALFVTFGTGARAGVAGIRGALRVGVSNTSGPRA